MTLPSKNSGTKREDFYLVIAEITQLQTHWLWADRNEDISSLRGILNALQEAYLQAATTAGELSTDLFWEFARDERLGLIEEIPNSGGN